MFIYSYNYLLHAITEVVVIKATTGETVVDEYEVGYFKVRITKDGCYHLISQLKPNVEQCRAFLDYVLPYVIDFSQLNDDAINELLEKYPSFSKDDKAYLKMMLSGYGVIYPFLQDPKLTDIIVLPDRPVKVVHQEYGELLCPELKLSIVEVRKLAIKLSALAGESLSYSKPLIKGAKLRDGSRLAASIGGKVGVPHVVIRKFPKNPWTLHKIVARNTLTPEMAALLWLANEAKVAIVIYGPMGSGKTSLAGAIIATVRPEQSIKVIQDMPEIKLSHPYADYLSPVEEIGINYESLVSYALRASVDYVIMNEVKDSKECLAFVQAISIGHGGVTTLHAPDVQSAVNRLFHYGAYPPDVENVRVWVGMGVFYDVYKGMRTKRRVVKSIEYLDYIEGRRAETVKLYGYDRAHDSFIEVVPLEKSQLFELLMDRLGIDSVELRAKLRIRAELLDFMALKYRESRLVESAEEWLKVMRLFYEDEDTLIRLAVRNEDLKSKISVMCKLVIVR